MEAKFQIFMILLAVLAGTALLARRINIAPAILLMLAGIALAFVPGMPAVELPPDLVLLMVLPPLIYSASVAMSWREFKSNLRPIILLVGRLRDLHGVHGCRRDALPDRTALERRLPAGGDRCPAGRGGAARNCAQTGHAAPYPRRARGRRACQRRHRVDPLPVRGRGHFDRAVLAAEGHRHLRGHRRLRDPVRRWQSAGSPCAHDIARGIRRSRSRCR